MSRKPKKAKAEKAEVLIPEEVVEVRGRGRPSLYKPEYADEYMKMCMLGMTDDECADYFGITRQTLWTWKKQYQNFSDAGKLGKEKADMSVVFSAFERAKGCEYIEQVPIKIKDVVYAENGKKIRETERVEIIEVTKRLPADPTMAQFWLRNRRWLNWRERREIEIGKPGDFAAMQDDELLRFIQEETAELSRGLGTPKDESVPRVVVKGTESRH